MDLPFSSPRWPGAGCSPRAARSGSSAQLNALRRWGWGLAGELRQAAARDPDRVAVIDERGAALTYASCWTAPNGWPGPCAAPRRQPATGSACSAATTAA